VNAVFGSEAHVSLQSPSLPVHPWALIADLPWEEVEEGAPVTASSGQLIVGQFVLPLTEADVVDLAFHPPEHPVSPEELQARVDLIEQLLAETPDPFESNFDRAFVRDRDRILAEWQETGDPAVLLDLIGRGPGTTPASDDTLIGLLAGLEVLAAVAPAVGRPLLQATRHMLHAGGLPPTSLLSAQALSSAAAGAFPFGFLGLQRALANQIAGAPGTLAAAERSLHTGHTTGRSAVVGLVSSLGMTDRAGTSPSTGTFPGAMGRRGER
jgi:hypothetical protein